MASSTSVHSSSTARAPTGAAFLLGFALAGFLDGILLHQVLQWHHLLSNVESVRDLRAQILADGLFHVLMYVLALVAIVQLWRARAALGGAGAGRMLAVAALFGFAAWQAVDVVGFHWLAGIHRVRVGVPNPLAYDIGWLLLLGGPPLAAALWLRRRAGASGGRGGAAVLAVGTLAAGMAATLPVPGAGGDQLVVFAPGVAPHRALAALGRLDAQVRWVDPGGGVWAVTWRQAPAASVLLREGAVLAGGTGLALGCVSAMRTAQR